MSILKYYKRTMKARMLTGDVPAWLAKHSRGVYIKACVMSCPPWLKVYKKELQALDETKRALTRATGVAHVLDHVVPVTHPYVCGLTVPWNLAVVPYAVNACKSNKWSPDQPDLFIDQVGKHETYELF